MEAPYPIAIYGNLLASLSSSATLVVESFSSTGPPPQGAARLFLRHDVDTAACATNLEWMLDEDRRRSFRPATFIRMDGAEYDPASLAGLVAAQRALGLEFGLHTSCYLEDDYFSALAVEADAFAHAFGFRPTSFTVHGMGTLRATVRARFAEEISDRLGEWGFRISDCHARLRSYDYVIEDCHCDPATGSRFIYEDFQRLPPFLATGFNYLVLTHPCYWRAAG